MQYAKNMLKAIYFTNSTGWTVSLKVERILDMDVAEERYLYGPPPTLGRTLLVTRRSEAEGSQSKKRLGNVFYREL